MKVCISSTGPTLNSMVDPRFGRCQYLLFVNSETGKVLKAEKNSGVHAWQGAGITTAQIVADNKIEAIITGNIGPNAFDVLQATGIKVYTGIFDLTVKQAVAQFQKGQLKLMPQPTVMGHFGIGAGRGQGGFGPGRRGFGTNQGRGRSQSRRRV